MTKYTNGNYWPYHQTFTIYARSWKEAEQKIKKMEEIALKKEYQKDV
jgi:hypothetical protein